MNRTAKFSTPGITIALALVAVVILGGYGLVAFRAIPPQPNIFAEIYADTEKNYERYPAILQIRDTGQKGGGFFEHDPPEPTYYFQGDTKELIDHYNILSDFNFYKNRFHFKFSRKINDSIRIVELIEYSVQDHTLTRKVGIRGDGGTYTVNDTEYIAQILQKFDITRADLEDYYQTAIEDYVLTEWVKLHASEFSPTNYGEITIIDEWDRYFEQDS